MLFQELVGALGGIEHIETLKSVSRVPVELHFIGQPALIEGLGDFVGFADRHDRVGFAVQNQHRSQLREPLDEVIAQAAEEIDNGLDALLLRPEGQRKICPSEKPMSPMRLGSARGCFWAKSSESEIVRSQLGNSRQMVARSAHSVSVAAK